MREGCVLKTLGDLFSIGSSKRVYESQWRTKGVPFYRAREIVRLSRDGYVDNELFIDEELYVELSSKYGIPKAGDIMVTGVGTLGICYIVKENDRFYFKDGNTLWFKTKEGTNPQYVQYAFKSEFLRRQIDNCVGATVGTFTIERANKTTIPVPSFEEQERIVAELDLLTGIIDKQKQQLKELDTLAQSIFYDMFGNPEYNEKGWDECKISSVCDDLFAGGDKPSDFSEDKNDVYKYPIIGNGDGERGILGYSKSYRVDRTAVTIGARGASIGNCRICEPFFTPVIRLITIVPNEKVNISYLHAISKRLSFNINGAGQAQLTTPNVANKKIPVPPLELQEAFAKKIQAIESQKESINRSLAESQKLFDYTMDKYFG